MRYILTSIVLVFAIQGISQKTLKCQAVSIKDSTPLAGVFFKINYKTQVTTDSSGYFSVSLPLLKKSFDLYTYYELRGADTITSSKRLLELKLYISKTVDSTLAKYDLEHNKMLLYCAGGYAPMAPLDSDPVFEKKYGVNYHYLDCVMPEPGELAAYNKIIAEYLDQKFGKEWRKQVRPDVFGVTK